MARMFWSCQTRRWWWKIHRKRRSYSVQFFADRLSMTNSIRRMKQMEILPSIGEQLQFSRLLSNVKNITRRLKLSRTIRRLNSVTATLLCTRSRSPSDSLCWSVLTVVGDQWEYWSMSADRDCWSILGIEHPLEFEYSPEVMSRTESTKESSS